MADKLNSGVARNDQIIYGLLEESVKRLGDTESFFQSTAKTAKAEWFAHPLDSFINTVKLYREASLELKEKILKILEENSIGALDLRNRCQKQQAVIEVNIVNLDAYLKIFENF